MGAPICPGCSKFCSLETQEPEVNAVDIIDFTDGVADVQYDIRLVRSSECCSEEIN